MALSTSVRTAIRTLGQRPADLLSIYALGAAVPVVGRVCLLVGAVLAVLYLEFTGRLELIRAELATIDISSPDPESEEELVEWGSEVGGMLDPILTTTDQWVVGGLLVLAIGGTLLVTVVLSAAITGGQLATCFARLRDKRGIVAGIRGARRYWTTFLGLFVLEIILWGGSAVIIGLVVGGIILVAPSNGSLLLTGFLAVLGVAGWLLVIVLVRSCFAFSYVAVVVDDSGLFDSLVASVGFIRRRPLQAGIYLLVAFGLLSVTASLTSLLALFEAGSIVSLASVLLVLPALDLFKTALYGNYRGSISPPPSPEDRFRTRLRRGVRAGVTELGRFIRQTPGLHLLAIAVMMVGFWMGLVVSTPLTGILDTSIEARIDGLIPPIAAIEFFANNWLVALTSSFAGVVLVIPTITALWANGFAFGLLGGLEVDPLTLLAFVTPHGLLEIPALFVSGALGISLGITGWRTLRGRKSVAGLADEIERAFWVLVGVGLMLAVAGFIEGFISPYYFRLFL